MPLYHYIVLALVQGITEFLPVSSSGHLALVPHVLELPDQGLDIDIAVHVGTLGAVLLYLWRDVLRALIGSGQLVRGRRTDKSRLALHLLIGTLPLIVIGYLAKDFVGDMLRSLEIIGWTTLGFGLVLWFADRTGMTILRVEHMRWGHALVIGSAQILALVPGTSRSGITMTAARLLGYERTEAARFSMLLSIPAILGAGTLLMLEIYQAGNLDLGRNAAFAAGLAFVAALLSIWGMMALLRHATFGFFVVWRVLLGGGLLLWVYGVV